MLHEDLLRFLSADFQLWLERPGRREVGHPQCKEHGRGHDYSIDHPSSDGNVCRVRPHEAPILMRPPSEHCGEVTPAQPREDKPIIGKVKAS